MQLCSNLCISPLIFLYFLGLGMSGVAHSEVDRSQSRDDPLSNILRVPGVAELQAQTKGDRAVCIAVLDGPVDLSHPCLVGADLTTVGNLALKPAPSGGALLHGTHVASVLFGQPGTSVEGVAPRCRGLIVPVFQDGPDGTIAPCSEMDLARAITLATERGADIINISGGRLAHGGEAGQFLTDAVKQSAEQDVLVVAAGGNDGCECLHVPAALPNVIAVGAMDVQGRPLESSNWGHRYLEQGVLALGQGILGATPGGGVARLTGTSFATPIVTGVVGLLLSLQHLWGDLLDAAFVRDAILKTASPCDPGVSNDCRRHLVGTLNVSAAHDTIAHGAGRGPPEPLSITGKAVASVSDFGRRNRMTTVGEAQVSVQPSSAASEQAPGPASPPPQENPADTKVSSGTAKASETSLQPADSPADLVSPSEATAAFQTPLAAAPEPGNATIAPSACCAACAAAEQRQLIYVLGHLSYDFGTEARMDSIQSEMGGANALVASDLLQHLETRPESATAVIWTLNLDLTPIYAIQPSGTFGAETYRFLRDALAEQLPVKGKKEIDVSERVSVAGVITGEVRLLNGLTIPVITPELRGMFNWSTKALIQELKALTPKGGSGQTYDPFDGLENFLRRIYEECRNLGASPQDRAKNYAATNAYSLQNIFAAARSQQMHMEAFTVTKSPICRPGSDCWDIELKFYYPKELWNRARDVWIMTVDVSDIVPVVVGAPRHWTTI